jgi:hypothetical protein
MTAKRRITGDLIESDLMRVITGHQRGTRGPASTRVVKLGETLAFFGEPVEIGCRDFPAVTSQVGIAEIIGKDHEHVGMVLTFGLLRH